MLNTWKQLDDTFERLAKLRSRYRREESCESHCRLSTLGRNVAGNSTVRALKSRYFKLDRLLSCLGTFAKSAMDRFRYLNSPKEPINSGMRMPWKQLKLKSKYFK